MKSSAVSSTRRFSVAKYLLLSISLLSLTFHTSATPLSTSSTWKQSNTINSVTRGLFDLFSSSSSPSPSLAPVVISSPEPETTINEPVSDTPAPEDNSSLDEPMLTPTPMAAESTPLAEQISPLVTPEVTPTPDFGKGADTSGTNDENTSSTDDDSGPLPDGGDDPDMTKTGPSTAASTGGFSLITIAALAIAILVPGFLIFMAIRRRSSGSNQGFVNMPAAPQPNTYSGENPDRQSSFTVGR